MALLLGATGSGATAGPVGASVTITVPTTPSAGVIQDFAVRVQDGSGVMLSLDLTYADGTSEAVPGRAMCPQSGPVGGYDNTYTFRHAYRHGAVYPVSATLRSSSCTGSAESVATAATVVVLPAATASNGPQPVEARLAEVAGKAGVTTVDIYARDGDGVVTSSIVDWGDGKRWGRVFAPRPCIDPILHWPTSSTGIVRLTHRYTAAKPVTVTLTSTSAGCDGKSRQVKVQRIRVDPQSPEKAQGGLGGTAPYGPAS